MSDEPVTLDALPALIAALPGQWTSIEMHSNRRLTRWCVEISRLGEDGEEDVAMGRGDTPSEALRIALAAARAWGFDEA